MAPSATSAGVAVGVGTQSVQAAREAARRLTDVEGTITLISTKSRRRTATIEITHGVWDDTDIVHVVMGSGTATLDVAGDGRVMGISLNYDKIEFLTSAGDGFDLEDGRGRFRLPNPIYIDDIIIGFNTFVGAVGLLLPAVQ